MKAKTLQNRLAKIKNLSKGSKGYQIVKSWITKENNSMVWNNIIRSCHTSGKGRFTSNLDYTEEVKRILDSMNVEYIFGNDSPRGGKTGNYIKITTKIEY